jgi:hypothetical protein
MLRYSHLRHATQWATVVVALLLLISSCARSIRPESPPARPVQTAELWQEPTDLDRRDLFLGPGGQTLRPADAAFQFLRVDAGGASTGYDVRDARGIEWSAKVGIEAQSEVAVSRILWAIGFHQPPIYFIRDWTMAGAPDRVRPEPARFRPDLPDARAGDHWSWYENPFIGTRPFAGLIVANLLLTQWDWKASNNRIYELASPRNDVRRWYVVRDLGASLGRFTYPRALEWTRLRGFGQGTKNDLAGFEQQPFLETGGGFEIAYRGIYRDLVKTVTPADVRWTCELLARLSDRQWTDAFRAAGYTPEQTARYVNKLKAKIAQGLALPATSAPR